jgi:putative transcriptional regulator
MKCLECGKEIKVVKESRFHYTMSGLSKVYLNGVTNYKCSCGESEVEIPNIEQLHEVLADTIATQQTRLAPEEIRFLRSHLGLSGVDFARRVGAAPETVSRWENGLQKMSDPAERLLRLLILAKKAPVTDYEFLDQLAVRESASARKRILKVDHQTWHVEAA